MHVINAWGALAGVLRAPTQVMQVTAAGLALCLLGWAAWTLSSIDTGTRRRNRLFPHSRRAADRGSPGARRNGRGAGRAARPGVVRRLRRRLRRGLHRRRVQPPPELLLLPLGLLAAWPTRSPLVAALAAGAVLPAIRLRVRRHQAREREQRRLAVAALCAALAGSCVRAPPRSRPRKWWAAS
ncbi:hypothetical protein GXW82_30545 [Streptacidiphilus sp. 4-A2]|nr:hypothetical protein [Streptacidiphilus sp. 4-A2]